MKGRLSQERRRAFETLFRPSIWRQQCELQISEGRIVLRLTKDGFEVHEPSPKARAEIQAVLSRLMMPPKDSRGGEGAAGTTEPSGNMPAKAPTSPGGSDPSPSQGHADAPQPETGDGSGSAQEGRYSSSTPVSEGGAVAPAKNGIRDAVEGAQEPSAEGTGGHSGRPQDGVEDTTGQGKGEMDPLPSSGGGAETPSPALSEEERNTAFQKATKAGKSSPSTTSRQEFGGVFGDLAKMKPDPSLKKKALSVFRTLLKGGEGQPGPRWQGTKMATKIAGFLRPPSLQDRKEEEGRPAILIMADVSGSMSAFASEVLSLSLSLHRALRDRVVVVAHSNGYPQQILVQNSVRPVTCAGDVVEWWQDLVRAHQIRVVVSAADWDGEWLYRQMAGWGLSLYWLDPWSCSRMPAKIVPFGRGDHGGHDWPAALKARVKYAIACGTAAEAIQILKKMERR